MYKSFGNKSYVVPCPVVLIGSYDKEGRPNLMNAAWGTPYDYDKVVLTLDKNHKTTKNILETKALTITFGTKQLVKVADYVGLVSQEKNPNKLDNLGLNIVKSDKVNAPLFTDFPLSLECELIDYNFDTEMMLVKVINTLVDDAYLNEEGKINALDMHLLAYNSLDRGYYELNTKVAQAFSCGKELIEG